VAHLPALVVLAHGDMAPRQHDGRGGDGGASVTQALGSVQGPDVLVDERAVAQLNQVRDEGTLSLSLTLSLTLSLPPPQGPKPSPNLEPGPEQIVRNFEPLLVAARADRHQLDFDRQMREEQVPLPLTPNPYPQPQPRPRARPNQGAARQWPPLQYRL
jgi:hypothetical protein